MLIRRLWLLTNQALEDYTPRNSTVRGIAGVS